MTREEKAKKADKKAQLIEVLAKFLTEDLGRKSIELQMQRQDARRWAELYTICGLGGYATENQAVHALQYLLYDDED